MAYDPAADRLCRRAALKVYGRRYGRRPARSPATFAVSRALAAPARRSRPLVEIVCSEPRLFRPRPPSSITGSGLRRPAASAARRTTAGTRSRAASRPHPGDPTGEPLANALMSLRSDGDEVGEATRPTPTAPSRSPSCHRRANDRTAEAGDTGDAVDPWMRRSYCAPPPGSPPSMTCNASLRRHQQRHHHHARCRHRFCSWWYDGARVCLSPPACGYQTGVPASASGRPRPWVSRSALPGEASSPSRGRSFSTRCRTTHTAGISWPCLSATARQLDPRAAPVRNCGAARSEVHLGPPRRRPGGRWMLPI